VKNSVFIENAELILKNEINFSSNVGKYCIEPRVRGINFKPQTKKNDAPVQKVVVPLQKEKSKNSFGKGGK